MKSVNCLDILRQIILQRFSSNMQELHQVNSKKKSEIKANEKINNEVQNRISELQDKIKKKEDEIKTNTNKETKINQFSKQIVSYSSQIDELIEKRYNRKL